MTNSSINKLKNVYKLLLSPERNLTIISDINIDLKCIICKGVLVNACQNVCGCNFCERCINNYKRDGGTCCPGDTEECRQDDLSNIMTDHRRNREISRLRVRCDKYGCEFECKLIDLEEHRCRGKEVSCPFENIGCDEKEQCFDRMNEHLQKECYNHNILLIELIGNLRNEMRENEEKNKCEIIMLRENVNKMTKQIEKDGIELERLKENWNEEDKDITVLKERVKMKDRKIELLRERFDLFLREKDKLFEEIKNEKEIQKKEIFDEMSSRIDEVERYLDLRDGAFVWDIGDINQLNYIQYSSTFYMRDGFYRMQLGLIDCKKVKYDSNIGEFREIYDDVRTDVPNPADALIVGLLIYREESNVDLDWPLRASVTVKMVNSCAPNVSHSVTNECIIDQPDADYQIHKDFGFIFYKSEMCEDINLLKSFRVECVVKMIDLSE